MITLGTLMLAQPSHAAACVNGVYRAGCVGPNGAVGVRKAYPHHYGYGYHHRPVSCAHGPYRAGCVGPHGLRSFAGHISCNNPRGSGENEPQRIIDSIVRVLAIRRPVSSGDFAQACGSDPDQATGRLALPGIVCRNSPRSYCRRSDEPHCRQRASAPVLISGIRRHAGAQLPPEVHSSGITNERVRKWP
jgi:hypothetical protein